MHVSDEQFQAMVDAAVAAIPPRFAQAIDNVVFVTADSPTPDQLAANGELHGGGLLLGLYEGIPLPLRAEAYSMVVPDVITVFKLAHEQYAADLPALESNVRETIWHEVAHYFGLDHAQIDALGY